MIREILGSKDGKSMSHINLNNINVNSQDMFSQMNSDQLHTMDPSKQKHITSFDLSKQTKRQDIFTGQLPTQADYDIQKKDIKHNASSKTTVMMSKAVTRNRHAPNSRFDKREKARVLEEFPGTCDQMEIAKTSTTKLGHKKKAIVAVNMSKQKGRDIAMYN